MAKDWLELVTGWLQVKDLKREPNTEYILSLSYGKDSIACIFAIILLGLPLDRIVHAEVWATDTISADLPPMLAFKSKADQIIFNLTGLIVEHLCAMRNGEKLTYEKLFYHVPKRKSEVGYEQGSPAGFPYTKGAWCNDRLKTNSLDAIARDGGGSPVSHISGEHGAIPNSKSEQCSQYSRFPDYSRKLVQQRPQTESFPKAPLHKERRKILCSTSVLRLMNLSA